MQLLHHLTLTCLKFQVVVKSVHLEGLRNGQCDQIGLRRADFDAQRKSRHGLQSQSTISKSVAPGMAGKANGKHGKMKASASSPHKRLTKKTPVMTEVSRNTLVAFGFKYPDSIINNHSAKKLQGLVNYNLVCYYANLKLKWGTKQVCAFLEMLD